MTELNTDFQTCNAINYVAMTDTNEIGALKASFRGAVATAAALAALGERVEALDVHADVAPDLLEEIARITLAHANASQALRGFVATMQARRG
jgi:hypothetical protein